MDIFLADVPENLRHDQRRANVRQERQQNYDADDQVTSLVDTTLRSDDDRMELVQTASVQRHHRQRSGRKSYWNRSEAHWWPVGITSYFLVLPVARQAR